MIPVILAGGSGTRLWPLSRKSFPKQFLAIKKENKFSLLQETYLRLKNLESLSKPIIICNEEHRFITAEQMREIKVDTQAIILEPFGKNTAPAITLAALKSLKDFKDPLLLILSADHIIQDQEVFIKAINKAKPFANQGRIVTFGILPTSAHTGYGYIEAESELCQKMLKGEKIKRFLEKPSKEIANKLIQDKKYSWNSGIFLCKASVILKELNKFAPEIIKYCESAIEKITTDLDFLRINKSFFSKCPSLSIDVAVMEKTNLGTVLPLDAGWNDIGSWQAVWENETKDSNNNVLQGKAIFKDSKNCYSRSDEKLVVGLGLEDLIIIDTKDALLISNKNNTQEIKSIVDQLKEKGFKEGERHKKVYRPWGNFLSISEAKRWQVKRIEVKPGAKLSLQMHHHRSEHWIVVSGTAKVQINDDEFIICENQSTYIPLGSKHRLFNPGRIPLVLIEVQSGAYLEEDDILRFEDKYGRKD